MTRYRILSIYSSQQNCETIIRDKKNSLPYIHLDVIAVRAKLSLKKVFADRKKKCPLKKTDYVIAIDYSPKYVFKKDKEEENLLHFVSLNHFYLWLNPYE